MQMKSSQPTRRDKIIPTKLWEGNKRLALSFLGKRKEILTWAIGVRIGDYIATCEGCNRKVDDIEYIWKNEGASRRGKPNKTWVLDEVIFTDTNGRVHYCPGGGCALPKESIKEIEQYHRELIEEYKDDKGARLSQRLLKMKDALDNGRPVVDEYGEYIELK